MTATLTTTAETARREEERLGAECDRLVCAGVPMTDPRYVEAYRRWEAAFCHWLAIKED
jgi:hypothetical protein